MGKQWQILFFWAPKSLQMVTAAMKIKILTPLKKSYDQPRQHIRRQRHYFANKGPSSQGYGFSSGHIWVWELDYKESWVSKNWCFFYHLIFNWRLITLQYCGGFCHTFTWISHECTCVPHPDPPSHLPPHPLSQGHPSAPALSTLSHASNLDWRSISHMLIYMFQRYSLKSSHPCLLPWSPTVFFTSVSL